MKTAVLALSFACLVAAPVRAQHYQYHLLLDSTASAARSALLNSGHSAGPSVERADGLRQSAFTTGLPDSAGNPTRGEMHVIMVSHGDTITRIQVSAEARGPDSTAVKAAARYFVGQLTTILGRPASSGEEAGWCWSTRRHFIDLLVDRAYGSVSLALNYGSQGR